ncbi:MAG: peptidylprolyl isomerase, partial [Flammeovirgaceae bacterium]
MSATTKKASSKAKKTTLKPEVIQNPQEKEIKLSAKTPSKKKIITKKTIKKEPKKVESKISKPEAEVKTEASIETQKTTTKTHKEEPKKSETLKKEAGFNLVSLTSLSIIAIIIASFVIWEFALPKQYQFSTLLENSRVEKYFLRADKLEANDTYDVAIFEPCNLAIRYNKTKYNAEFRISENGNFGVYDKPFKEIFENKSIVVYEFSLTEKLPDQTNQNQPDVNPQAPSKAAAIACLAADKTKNVTAGDLDAIMRQLEEKIRNEFDKEENTLENMPFFKESSRKYLGKNLFRKINIKTNQPEIEVKNSFFAVDNSLVYVAQQNNPDDIELQINSLNPSNSSTEFNKQIDEFKNQKKELNQKLETENKEIDFDENKSWELKMEIQNFGDLKIKLNGSDAPKTVENFVRLSHRGYFNDTVFHRMVKEDQFAVIQGGDKENADGTGGKSAFYLSENNPGFVVDEIWEDVVLGIAVLRSWMASGWIYL